MATGKPCVEIHTHETKKDKKFLVSVTAAPISKGSEEPIFLHVTMPIIDKKRKKKEIISALNKTLDILKVVNLYQEQMKEIKEKTKILAKTKKELEEKIGRLEKFNKLTVGRELRVIELKEKIQKLENQFLNK